MVEGGGGRRMMKVGKGLSWVFPKRGGCSLAHLFEVFANEVLHFGFI